MARCAGKTHRLDPSDVWATLSQRRMSLGGNVNFQTFFKAAFDFHWCYHIDRCALLHTYTSVTHKYPCSWEAFLSGCAVWKQTDGVLLHTLSGTSMHTALLKPWLVGSVSLKPTQKHLCRLPPHAIEAYSWKGTLIHMGMHSQAQTHTCRGEHDYGFKKRGFLSLFVGVWCLMLMGLSI